MVSGGVLLHTLEWILICSAENIGLDAQLSRHMAHLFIRDPLVVFSETIDQDDANSNDHFEVRLRLCLPAYTLSIAS